MKYNIKTNWVKTFELILQNRIVLAPFIIIGLIECLVLELAYFSARAPLSGLFGPIIKKFFGEAYLHYPASISILPKLFYYGQTFVYVFISVFLAAVAVQIFVNIRAGLPVIVKAIVKNTAKRYLTFVGYGLIYVTLMAVLEKAESVVFFKGMRFISRHMFKISPGLYSAGTVSLLFVTFVFIQTLFISTIPLIILDKKSLLKAIAGSVVKSVMNFIKVFCLILVPLSFYLPSLIMSSFLSPIMDKTFPEVGFYITLLTIVTAVFVDCFILMVMTQFLLDTKKAK
ncbi:MAG: hypothetical protein WCY36_01815 [Candidatus Omnitrophota bacterium]